jgi:peptidoglycan/LPS O-acetylase OafA/YrhL
VLWGVYVVTAGLALFGVYQVGVGLFMAVAPGSFFDTLGPFGPENVHYIVDTATFEFPLGVVLLASVPLASWRVPVLAYATLHWALHAVNHLVDIGEADPSWIGVFDFAALTAGTSLLAVLLVLAGRERGAQRT